MLYLFLNMRLKSLISFFLVFVTLQMLSQQIETLNFYKNKVLKLQNWELYLIRNPLSIYQNTPSVLIKDSRFNAETADLSRFTGVCWFRKVFKVDSTFRDKHLVLQIELTGAAEVYLNKKRIKTIGTVSSAEESEVRLNTSDVYIGVNLKEETSYELLIRYSNHGIHTSSNSDSENLFGPNVYIETTNSILRSLYNNSATITIGISFFVFFFTLFFVHLVIYLYNKNAKSNLYYSVFCFIISLLLFSVVTAGVIQEADLQKVLNSILILTPALIFTLLPCMFRSFFTINFPKWYRLLFAFTLLTIMMLFIQNQTFLWMSFAIILIGCFECIRIFVLAVRKKLHGVRIIGVGLISTITMVVAIIIIVFTVRTITIEDELWSWVFLILIVFVVISIPVSITVLLANNISRTNSALANKLIEVEELSAKSLAQEKEKQLLLENQNTTLEKQVTERTFEIREQKKLIEEKNKDIIDSINYARRIQAAMLPEEKQFKIIFSDSFILYQPRDIVSGDFYYAAELGENKLIIAADCTGHGVPGALMSMVGCNIINKLTHENKISDPKTILETLHIELRHALKQDLQDSMNRDGMDVAVVLVTNEEIIYAAANRPLIYFDKENVLHEVKPSKTPIGGSHNQTVSIEQHRILKSQVSQFFLFSDGFADQFGGPQGKKLMVSKFKLWLMQISTLSTENQFQFLTKNFQEWKQNSEQVDDVMVIGIKI